MKRPGWRYPDPVLGPLLFIAVASMIGFLYGLAAFLREVLR
jgi:hypothetical protein